MESVRELLERNAALFPQQPAAVCEGRSLTYRQLRDRALRLGAALHAGGACHQDRIAILAMNCLEYFEVYAAAHLAGYITATVNFRLAAPEVAYVLNDSAPHTLIFEAQYADLIDGLRVAGQLPAGLRFVCIGGPVPAWAEVYEDLMSSGDAAGAPIRADGNDIALLVYTSGTTGRPKGVMKTHRAEIARASMFTALDVRPGGRMLLMMPMFHVGSGSMYLAQYWGAGTVHLHRSFDARAILQTIQDERITITHMAPTMVQAVLDVPEIGGYDLSSLQTLCYTAAPMPVPLLKRGLEILGPVFANSWGMTEGNGTVMHKHQHVLGGTPAEVARLASVGQALPEVQLRVVDGAGRDCAVDEVGELIVRSPTQLIGYWNNSPATIETLRHGWLHTGDMARLDDEGFVFLVDRKKDMIISGGENIYCQEVEQVLIRHAGLKDVAVIGVPDAYWGEAVKAVAVREPGASVSAEELMQFCAGQIARYKLPRSIDFVDELPRLPSGKVNKVVLRERYRAVAAVLEGRS